MTWVLDWGVVEWLAIGIGAHFAWQLAKDVLAIRRHIREYRRLGRRKQDWTPREDPALWRNE